MAVLVNRMTADLTKTAILTYHRIIDERQHGVGRASFYDLPLANFRLQMDIVASRKRTSAIIGSPILEITFDDGTIDHLHIAEVLAERGLSGIFLIVIDRLDTLGHLRTRDLQRLVALGQRVGSHTVSHRHLPSLSSEEQYAELGDF